MEVFVSALYMYVFVFTIYSVHPIFRGHEIFHDDMIMYVSYTINIFIAWSNLWILWTNGNSCIYEQQKQNTSFLSCNEYVDRIWKFRSLYFSLPLLPVLIPFFSNQPHFNQSPAAIRLIFWYLSKLQTQWYKLKQYFLGQK